MGVSRIAPDMEHAVELAGQLDPACPVSDSAIHTVGGARGGALAAGTSTLHINTHYRQQPGGESASTRVDALLAEAIETSLNPDRPGFTMPRLHVGIEPNARVTVDVADDMCIRQSVLLRRVLDERSDPSGPVPVALQPEAFHAWLAGVEGARDRYFKDMFGSIEVRMLTFAGKCLQNMFER